MHKDHKQILHDLQFKTLLLNNCPDSVFVHDLHGNIIYVNKAAYEDRGYSREELTAMNLENLISPPYNQTLPHHLKVLGKRGYDIYKSAHLKKDKTILPVEVSAKIFKFKGRDLAVSVAKDISKERQARQLSDALNQIESRDSFYA